MMTQARLLSLLLMLVLMGGVAQAIGAEESIPATTVIVVRHAEKEAYLADPGLTPVGEERSLELRDLTIEAGVTAVYASQYRRTQATVQPLAEALDLDVGVVDAREPRLLAEMILSSHSGEVIVVAGHSNTVPAIVAALGAPEPEEIPETAYGNLFVVTVSVPGQASVVRLKF
jgi:broad specificity phosphatase PhoE